MFFMLNLLLLSLILIILNVILLSHYHCCISTFQLCLQYLHVPVPLLVKQLLATAVFVSVLRTAKLSWALSRADSDCCVSRGEISHTSEHSWRSRLCSATGKRPLPFLLHPHITQIPPCAISHLAPQSKGARMILRYKEKRHMGTSKMCSLL